MKKLTSFAFAAVLMTAGPAAFAEQDVAKKNAVGPVAMTDAQMDHVVGGQLFVNLGGGLVDVNVQHVSVLNNNNVAVSVGAAVQALTNQSRAAANSAAFNR